MIRGLLTFVAATFLTALVTALTAAPGAPLWTALVAGIGGGFLAGAVVALEEGPAEDALKGVIFGFVGGALLYWGLPGWMGWPLVTGPWIGFVANRGRQGEGVPA